MVTRSAVDVLDGAIAQAKARVKINIESARRQPWTSRYRLMACGAFDLWRTLRRARLEALKREVGF